MNNSVDVLIKNYRALSWVASLSFVLFLTAILLYVGSVVAPVAYADGFSLVLGALLVSVMLLGFVSMLWSSWVLILRRKEVHDWVVFLVITWLIPYVGISFYLGGLNLVRKFGR